MGGREHLGIQNNLSILYWKVYDVVILCYKYNVNMYHSIVLTLVK